MPEWVIERGIGETRGALIEEGEIVEARIWLDGVPPAGTVLRATLKRAGTPAIAVAAGEEFLLPNGAPGVTEGASLSIEITRERIGGAEPWKRPLARATNAEPAPAPVPEGRELPFPSPSDELEDAGWSDLLEEARDRLVRFPGGELRVALTPAMTLIDVDGTLPPDELAIAGARCAARTIRRHGIGGSIGIDLPGGSKASRQAAAAAVDELLPAPFERTAVNGFGFLQIVRRRSHASLFEIASDRPAFEARALLRRAARSQRTITLVAHPAVGKVIDGQPEWLARLARQVGGAVSLSGDPILPISGGYVQAR